MACGLLAYLPASSPVHAMCGPSECTAHDPLYAHGQELDNTLKTLTEQLEKTYEAQQKLAVWLDSSGANPSINHQAILANNMAVFEIYTKAKCNQAAQTAQINPPTSTHIPPESSENPDSEESQQAQIYIQYAQCLIPEIKARIHALQNPEGDDYIWLK